MKTTKDLKKDSMEKKKDPYKEVRRSIRDLKKGLTLTHVRQENIFLRKKVLHLEDLLEDKKGKIREEVIKEEEIAIKWEMKAELGEIWRALEVIEAKL